MAEALVYDAVRTPRGRGKESGALYPVRPIDLLTTALVAARERNGFAGADVDDVIVGCVTQVGDQGGCIARFAALQAFDGFDAPGVTVNRFCGSGLEAVNRAAAMVMAGAQELVLAGGVESMSRVAMGADGGAMFDAQSQFRFGSVPQGISADLLATLRGFSRTDVDSFAVASQDRCAAALARGAFARSLVPVTDASGLPILARDEHPRPGTTVAQLAELKPSFEMMGEMFGLDALTRRTYPQLEKLRHVHHAGNASGIVDGAAAVVIGSRAIGEKLGRKPRARIRSFAVCGDEPLVMLTGPMPATRKALALAGMSVGDIDLFEVNEAFAAVPLAFMEELGVPHDKVNVNGGAIALGHPLGATGAILLGTILDALEDRGLSTGVVTLCIGGGMGIATVVERV